MKDCDFCRNALTDEELHHHEDLSYTHIGAVDQNYLAYYRTGDKRKTVLMVEYNNKGTKELAWIYAPKYCPECGRKLYENELGKRRF